ncbi:TIGR02449 family protein [Beggiatoa leptomitoformis]|uniref:TIGR02449 family protein n=1 Tax=Beggiatoa leptomitoformis TaxID=288004 RepID=A0A2N9YHX4_9GAMM|nr:TIGR02449 family protein [Beggiatoa leptomitoformis]ALG67665.1 TIGR02449 family protein [Beggiatoa leptomitoformis]AUI70100.1 TIGR02449 family protein [Beggiatoa leptomitoformis]
MENADLRLFENHLDELLAICVQLAEENRQLRQQQDRLLEERTVLLEKNQLARNRVEAMIERLKTLEINV